MNRSVTENRGHGRTRAIDGAELPKAPAGVKLSGSFGLAGPAFDPSVQPSVAIELPTLQEICAGLRQKKPVRPGQGIMDDRPVAEPFTGQG